MREAPVDDKIARLNEARLKAATEVAQSGLRGMKAELTEQALTDKYFRQADAAGGRNV